MYDFLPSPEACFTDLYCCLLTLLHFGPHRPDLSPRLQSVSEKLQAVILQTQKILSSFGTTTLALPSDSSDLSAFLQEPKAPRIERYDRSPETFLSVMQGASSKMPSAGPEHPSLRSTFILPTLPPLCHLTPAPVLDPLFPDPAPVLTTPSVSCTNFSSSRIPCTFR